MRGFGGLCGSDLHCFNHGGFGAARLREPRSLATRTPMARSDISESPSVRPTATPNPASSSVSRGVRFCSRPNLFNAMGAFFCNAGSPAIPKVGFAALSVGGVWAAQGKRTDFVAALARPRLRPRARQTP